MAPQRVAPCVNCGRDLPINAHNRCSACTVYLHRTGRERPSEGCWRRANAGPCRDCGAPAPSDYQGYCRSCYMRWWRRFHRLERASATEGAG